MRILILSYEFPPLGGGAGNATAELVKALGKNLSHEVVVVTAAIDDEKIKKYTYTPNSIIYYVPIGKAKGNIHYQVQSELLKYSYACHKLLKRLLNTETFDCCHAIMTLPAGFNAWLFRKQIPYIISLQGSDVPGYSERFRLLYPAITPIIHRIWKNAKYVVANSTGLRQLALESAPHQTVEVIPNGVDTELFCPAASDGANSEELRIICVGRLIERKGVWELLKAFKTIVEKIDNVYLDMVGTGSLEKALQQWIRDHRLERRAILHGAVDHDVLPTYLQRSALFVLPSHAEGMSNALAEAVASGLPVVVTDTGGTRELVQKNGVIVPKRDPDALAAAIIEILSNQLKRIDMVKASREIALGYSWETMAERYVDLYQAEK
jgi:glycosyltransferase involved in cell wall biosynthesis